MRAVLIAALFFCVSTNFLYPEELIIPQGINYKRAPDEVNGRAEELIRLSFISTNNHSYENYIFHPPFFCGPYLWHKIKNDSMTNSLTKSYNPFHIPVYENKTLVGYRFMLGRIAKSESDAQLFKELISKYIRLKDTFEIRRLTANELEKLWAIIAWDIQEPIFIIDDGETKLVVNFLEKDGKLVLFWIDDFSNGNEEIGEFYKTTDLKSALTDFMSKQGLNK